MASGPTHLIDIVFPGDTNHHDTLFGGTALSHMDKVAFVAATRYGRRSFVTASCERIDFSAPAGRGDIVDFEAIIKSAGRRSLSVQVDMLAEDVFTGEQVLCTRGVFHMVSPDKKAPPLPSFQETQSTTKLDPKVCKRIEMIFAGETNHFGTLFGGNALSMMGKTAFITATRYARQVFVMAACQRTDFIAPANEGEIIDLEGRVKYTGTSSLVCEVSMQAENLHKGERRLCAKSDFVMVSVGSDGKPVNLRKAS
jgi:acyl-CoA hydrolase